MNLLQKVIYAMLSMREKNLRFRLDKYLRSKAVNSTTKRVVNGSVSLTLNTETMKNIELIKKNMLDVVKNSNFNSEALLELIKKRGIDVVYIQDAQKLLGVLCEEEGLILERRGSVAVFLNMIAGNGIRFKTKPMFILEKGNTDFYFLLFHFYKMYEYFQKLPGMDYKSQELFRIYSKFPEKCDLSQLGFEELTALKEAVARDNEASEFVIEVSKKRDGVQNALKKLKDGGAQL